MAANWFYAVNGQQAGPVDVETLRQSLAAGSISRNDLVFGPGLTQWTPAEQVPALSEPTGAFSAQGLTQTAQLPAGASTLQYRGVETEATGLSVVAMNALRQTKPWVRFIAVMTFIGAGFMFIGGIVMVVAMAAVSTPGAAVPAWLGGIYVVMAIIYVIPGVLLNRYANGIARLMQTQSMRDVENALGAQRSFWKFIAILMIVGICLYFLGIGGAILYKVMH